jgi:microcystin-dependent protein
MRLVSRRRRGDGRTTEDVSASTTRSRRELLSEQGTVSLLALFAALTRTGSAHAQVPDVSGVPPGTITCFGGSTPPPGWLLADGSEVSRTQFADLFAAIGTAYGAGNGTTTFNVPDLRGRVPVGKGTASDVDALNDSDGLPVASRRIHHRHGRGTLNITDSGAHEHQFSQAYNVNSAYPGSATRGDFDSHYKWTENGQLHTHPNSSFAGEVGDTSGPLDAPAYLVVNCIIKD